MDKRKEKLLKKLPYVFVVNGRVVYRPYIKKKHRQFYEVDSGGFLKPPIVLGKPDDPYPTLVSRYSNSINQLELMRDPDRMTLDWFNDKYKKSNYFKKLSKSSKRDSRFSERIFEHKIQVAGHETTFGKLNINRLKPPTIRKILDVRLGKKKAEGKKGTASINHERSYLSVVVAYAIENNEQVTLEKNPVELVKPFEEEFVDEYITDERYKIQYDFIISSGAPNYLLCLHELDYLLACRGVEGRTIKVKHCTDKGIVVERRKGSKDTGIEWSPRLREAYRMALSLHKSTPIGDAPLVVNSKGRRLQESTYQSAMQRLKKKMEAEGLPYFTLHALKKKGVSDAENKAIAGQSEAMQRKYTTGVQWFEPPA